MSHHSLPIGLNEGILFSPSTIKQDDLLHILRSHVDHYAQIWNPYHLVLRDRCNRCGYMRSIKYTHNYYLMLHILLQGCGIQEGVYTLLARCFSMSQGSDKAEIMSTASGKMIHYYRPPRGAVSASTTVVFMT